MDTPQRIIWAYDELQSLGDLTVSPPAELFGAGPGGRPLVELHNRPEEPHQDVILPVCYRNTAWALVTAHALGFGVYRPEGAVQFFDDDVLWHDIGYEIEGVMAPGNVVTISRRPECSPAFFADLLRSEDAVEFLSFASTQDQTAWLAERIRGDLTAGELEPSDILVIFPDPLTVASHAEPLAAALSAAGIRCHIAGVTASRDELFVPDSVAISGIYRAKGNEAPMVYVADADYCARGPGLIRRRNMLFTAITRSRAWVRVAGVGPAMDELRAEAERVVRADYRLRLRAPSAEELDKMRRIQRDMTREEKRAARSAAAKMQELSTALERGEVDPDGIDPEVRRRLLRLLTRDGSGTP